MTTNKELEEKQVAEYIADKLKQLGYIKGERKCYTPKHGEGAYTIEEWDADTVGIFLAQDVQSLLKNQDIQSRDPVVDKIHQVIFKLPSDEDDLYPEYKVFRKAQAFDEILDILNQQAMIRLQNKPVKALEEEK